MANGNGGDNLKLWNRLEVTDKQYTKSVKRTGFAGTAVDPVYNIKRVTEQLGPAGRNWGWKVIEQRLDTIVTNPEDPRKNEVLHTLLLRLWFLQEDGQVREFDHIGHTRVAYWAGGKTGSGYVFVDEEFAKKSLTDALSKGLSCIGASADIWLGRFDSSKHYTPPPEEEPELSEAQRKRLLDDLDVELTQIPSMTEVGIDELRSWLGEELNGRTRWAWLGRIDPKLRVQLNAAINDRLDGLEPPKEPSE